MKKTTLFFAALFSIIYTNSSAQNWKVTGNNASSGYFLGTNNNQDLILKTNNNEAMRITKKGLVGVGFPTPTAKFDLVLDNTYPYTLQSGMRITYPIPVIGPAPKINTSIFHIRQKALVGTGYASRLIVQSNGRIGMGTGKPRTELHLSGSLLIDGKSTAMGTAGILFGANTGAKYGEWGIEYCQVAGGLNFWKPYGSTSGSFQNYALFIKDNGHVGIGTDDPKGYQLAVNGKMIAEEVVVKLHNNWPDYVFTDNYGLMPLKEVNSFIEENCHLPNVPSAEEVDENGINLGEMDAILLQKIEELTLYVIEQQKMIDELRSK